MKLRLAAAAALTLGVLAVGTDGASAAGGCGPGWHPNPWGVCRPNWGWRRHWRPVGFYGYARPGWGWHHHGWHHGWRRW